MLLDLVSNNKFLAWGEESLGGDIIRLLNAESSFKRNGLYSLEDILLANPDIIILWYMEDYNQPLDIRLEYLKNINILKDINAIRNNKIFPVHSSDLYNSGIRTIRGLRTIAEAIYPDLSFNN
jgi:ABC-type Fe3+-hydroxamate transport system substrate-binding protein